MDIMTLPKKGLKKYDYNIDMEKKDLKKLTKAQLIKLLLKQQAQKYEDIIQPQEPVPRKSVKQIVKEYEDIIQPPEQFRDAYKPIPKPRTDRPPKPTRKPPPVPQVEENITNVPVTKIKELNQALKGHAKSYKIELKDNLNPLNHFTKTRPQTESHLKDLLKTMKGFKFIETLEVTFVKDSVDSKTGKRVSIQNSIFQWQS